MLASERKVVIGKVPTCQRAEVLGAEQSKLLQEYRQRLASAFLSLGESVVRGETAIGALRTNDLCARDPIGALAVDEMTENLVRAPRVGALVRTCPLGAQIAEQCSQRWRRAREDRDRRWEGQCHGGHRVSEIGDESSAESLTHFASRVGLCLRRVGEGMREFREASRGVPLLQRVRVAPPYRCLFNRVIGEDRLVPKADTRSRQNIGDETSIVRISDTCA